MESDPSSSSSSSHADRHLHQRLTNTSRGFRIAPAQEANTAYEDQDQDQDKDILLLIYKYMRAKPGFSETVRVFQKELVSIDIYI